MLGRSHISVIWETFEGAHKLVETVGVALFTFLLTKKQVKAANVDFYGITLNSSEHTWHLVLLNENKILIAVVRK